MLVLLSHLKLIVTATVNEFLVKIDKVLNLRMEDMNRRVQSDGSM